MKALIILSAFSLSTALFGFSASGPVKVLTGAEGIKLTLVTVTGGQALIHFENTESALEGKVLLHSTETQADTVFYVTEWDGKRHVPLEKNSSTKFTFFPPSGNEAVVRYNQGKSEAASAEPILNRYFYRKPSDRFKGVLESFDRKEEMNREETRLTELLSSANGICGTKLSAKIEWNSVSDDVLKTMEVAQACGSALIALEYLCSVPSNKEAIGKKVKKVNCLLGTKLGAKLSSSELTFTTAPETPDQEGFLKKFLSGKL